MTPLVAVLKIGRVIVLGTSKYLSEACFRAKAHLWPYSRTSLSWSEQKWAIQNVSRKPRGL